MQFQSEYVDLIDGIIAEYGGFDLKPDGTHAGDSAQSTYLKRHRHEYLRTVQDVDSFFGKTRTRRIFEIGAFFGVVSIALARLGYDVVASDAPAYMDIPAQIDRFSREGIAIDRTELQEFVLNGQNDSFDCVIMCEVLEHLNFNPLPLLKEINRILPLGGLFYLSLPNHAQIRNRMTALKGGGVGIDIPGLFEQLDPNSPSITNGHWREYTMAEIHDMAGPLGCDVFHSYYFSYGEVANDPSLRKKLGRAFYKLFPAFKENQTNLLVKRERTALEFAIPPTVHPKLRQL